MPAFVDHLREEIRRVINERRLSVSDVSAGAGVSNSSLNEFLNGDKGMRIDNIGAVIDWLRKQAEAVIAEPFPPPLDEAQASLPATIGDIHRIVNELSAWSARPFARAKKPKVRGALHTKKRPA
jgi:transcriptional regulator with XRE-family HTH domain